MAWFQVLFSGAKGTAATLGAGASDRRKSWHPSAARRRSRFSVGGAGFGAGPSLLTPLDENLSKRLAAMEEDTPEKEAKEKEDQPDNASSVEKNQSEEDDKEVWSVVSCNIWRFSISYMNLSAGFKFSCVLSTKPGDD